MVSKNSTLKKAVEGFRFHVAGTIESRS